MRIPEPTLAVMRDALTPLDTDRTRARYLAGDFPNADRVQNLDQRYRWDLLWMAVDLRPELRTLFDGFNDNHIDTALRRLVDPLVVVA